MVRTVLTYCCRDGDFFRHFLDSPEQALLVIPLFADIQPRGGGTYIAPDGIPKVAKYLLEHPEGTYPQSYQDESLFGGTRFGNQS
jgi:hypothetical protein